MGMDPLTIGAIVAAASAAAGAGISMSERQQQTKASKSRAKKEQEKARLAKEQQTKKSPGQRLLGGRPSLG